MAPCVALSGAQLFASPMSLPCLIMAGVMYGSHAPVYPFSSPACTTTSEFLFTSCTHPLEIFVMSHCSETKLALSRRIVILRLYRRFNFPQLAVKLGVVASNVVWTPCGKRSNVTSGMRTEDALLPQTRHPCSRMKSGTRPALQMAKGINKARERRNFKRYRKRCRLVCRVVYHCQYMWANSDLLTIWVTTARCWGSTLIIMAETSNNSLVSNVVSACYKYRRLLLCKDVIYVRDPRASCHLAKMCRCAFPTICSAH